MIIDHTRPALLQKQKRSWGWLLHYINPWVGFQHFAYFFAPANQCVYCWILRMFLLGLLIGWHLTMWWYK